MPCNSEYMEPSVAERQCRDAAQLLIYVLTELGKNVPKYLREDAEDIYGGHSGDKYMKRLCKELSEMEELQIDRIVYNARSSESRRLADWWEEHQRQDKIREMIETKKKKLAPFVDMSREELIDKILELDERIKT